MNNAGARVMATLEQTTDDIFDFHVEVSLRGTFYGCKAVAPP